MKFEFTSNKLLMCIVLLLFFVGQLHGQDIHIKGKVSDNDGSPVAGASVIVKGTNVGTLSDEKGAYAITAKSSNDILVFSFIGFLREEVKVGDQTSINVTLVPDITALGNVVVMGYSEKKKTEITSAVSVLNGDAMKDVVAPDMTTMLQGKVAGVQISAASGQPGQAAEIRIRGTSTFTGNGLPLYVIDGIPAGQQDPGIDPNMIESVTILKDAGATGMFGSKANSGVIVITTKKGHSAKTLFEFSTSFGIKVPEFNNFAMMNTAELKAYRKDAYINRDGTFNDVGYAREWPDTLNTSLRNFDWLHAVYKQSNIQTYSLSASGMTDKFNYYIGASYYDEGGTFVTTGFKKISLRSNNTYHFSDRITLTGNIEVNAYKQRINDWEGVTYSIQNLPTDNPYDATGKLIRAADVPTWKSRWGYNGLQYIYNSEFGTNHIDNMIDLGLTAKILPWLSFSSNNRLSYYSSWNYAIQYPTADFDLYGIGQNQQTTDYGVSAGSTDLLKFNYTLGNHNISGLIGGEFGYSYDEIGFGGMGQKMLEGYSSFSTLALPKTLQGYSVEQAGESFISQVNYNFREKYFLSGSYRIDADSRFAPNKRVAAFPTISGSWLLSKEDFLKQVSLIDNLKIRASFGLTGNNNIGPNLYLAKYDLSQKYNNNTGANPNQLANPNLTWEKTSQADLGFDLDLLRRFEISFDYYHKKTIDLLIPLAQVLSTGYESAWTNFGKVYNNGVELDLSAKVFDQKDFSWKIDFNISKNTNKVGGVGNYKIQENIDNNISCNIDGEPVWSMFGPKWMGVDPATGACLWEHIEYDANGKIISRSNTQRYVDATPQIIGNPWPDFQGGLNTALRFRFVTLNANLSFSKGADVYNKLREQFDNDGKEPFLNQQKFINGWSRWEKAGDMATHPLFKATNIGSSNSFSSRYIEDGSYIKLRNISISFDLPIKWSHGALEAVQLTFSGNNLFTWTRYSGIDPEASLANTGWSLPGVSSYVYPLSKQFLASLHVKF